MRIAASIITCLASVLFACGGEMVDGGMEPAPIETKGYKLTLKTKFNPEGEMINFMTASASVITVESEFYRGKPWIGMLFEAGAEPGVDLPIHHAWGTVPDSLEFDYSPDIELEPGAYEMVSIVYAGTQMTPELMHGNPLELPFPSQKDVTTFTLDQSVVLEGDPDFAPGMIRVNLGEEDASVDCQNRWSTEEHDMEYRLQSFTNTYLILP